MKNEDIKKYYFSEKIAIDIGFEEAVMLYNLYHWVNENESRESLYNFKDGKYWTFDSVKTYSEKYPFWTISMIRRILKNLETGGYIETGRHNKYGYDKTKWYTVTEKCTAMIENGNGVAETDNWV